MSWTVFRCDNPDFRVRSVPDDITFGVKRSAMERSEAFRLPSGDSSEAEVDPIVDLHEPADVLAILLRILHDPPRPPEEIPSSELDSYVKKYDEATVIPLPLLELVVLQLVDKYLLDESITE
ncbi:hypothetical protein FA13DRAFT_1723334, partial [Coprinellus micaceus]